MTVPRPERSTNYQGRHFDLWFIIRYSCQYLNGINVVDIDEDLETAVRNLQEATHDSQATVSSYELLFHLRHLHFSRHMQLVVVFS